MTYSTDEARIMPAVAQGLQKPIPSIDLKVTAMAFGAKHLLIVCKEKDDSRRCGEQQMESPSQQNNKTKSNKLV